MGVMAFGSAPDITTIRLRGSRSEGAKFRRRGDDPCIQTNQRPPIHRGLVPYHRLALLARYLLRIDRVGLLGPTDSLCSVDSVTHPGRKMRTNRPHSMIAEIY